MLYETISPVRRSELQAIHRVVERTRTNAHHGVAGAELGKVLDDVQDLLALTMEQDGRDEAEREAEFSALLKDVEKRYLGFEGVAGQVG